MDPIIGAAAIGAGVNALGSLFSGNQNYKNTKKLMAYQNQMNIENWKMENQYNSPGAQMARLREAGLNPSLVYAGNTDNTGGSIGTSSPASMAGNIDLSQVGTSAVNTYMNAKLNQAQLENMQNQNDAIKAQINKTYQETIREMLGNRRESAYLGSYKEMADLTVAAARANLEGTGIENMLRRTAIRLNDINLVKIGSEIDNLHRQGKAIDEGIAQQWTRLAIDRALANSNIEVNNEQKKLIINNTANALRTGNLQAVEYQLKQFEFGLMKNSKLESNGTFVQNVLSGIYNNMVVRH